MIPTLGVDPGTSGAACLLAADGRTILGWWGWQRRKRVGGDRWALAGWDVATEATSLAVALDIVGGCVADLAGSESVALVVEGLAPHMKSSAASLIALGEAAGVALGALEPLCVGPAQRPRAETWRRQCLGAHRLDAEGWDRLAQRVVMVSGYAGLGDAATAPHVPDAILLARWGHDLQARDARRATETPLSARRRIGEG